MKNIIVAYPTKETAMQIRNVLENEGLYVSHICATGASVLGIASDLRGGVIICASILRDMSAGTLAERLPAGFDIVALSKGGRESYNGNYISLPLPLDRDDFIRTIEVLVSSESSFTNRTFNDAEYISQAKAIIMNINDMTEMQAHKHLQNESMRQSKKLVDIAKEIIENFS
jgi:response regulator NasT